MHVYTSESGRIFAQLVGEAQFDPSIADDLGPVCARRRTPMT